MKEVEKMRNSKYTKEFRDETVQLILNSEKSAMQIAKDLGINDKTIYNWIKVYKKKNNITTPIDETKNQSKSSQQELLAELKQLRAENKLLKQVKDVCILQR
ncbi:transposase [Arcobacter sp. L]|uniref:transposase n=2 Tax=Arcobacter sp. L TaxID=944547 RepID=UPI0002295E46|nr:transposase [Arcobacter sp. L]BAK72750.1 transposase [Arcobacter sp. L]